MREDFPWQDNPPNENGDFFYYGPLPDGSENVLAIVQIVTHPETDRRTACLLIPPGWRGDAARRQPVIHFGTLDQWKGQWAGPEYGLCCVIVSQADIEAVRAQNQNP